MSTMVDYASLKTAIASWLKRTDLTSKIGDYIALAEAKMSADIVSRAMQIRTVLNTVADEAYVTLPTDMVEMHRLIAKTDPIYVLQYRTPDELSTEYPTALVGEPKIFTVIGNELQLAPIPDAVYDLELTYQQRIPALSDSNTTNWLLTNYPNVYLYGALYTAQPDILNDERLPLFFKMYQEGVEAINSVDWYSGSTMRVRAK